MFGEKQIKRVIQTSKNSPGQRPNGVLDPGDGPSAFGIRYLILKSRGGGSQVLVRGPSANARSTLFLLQVLANIHFFTTCPPPWGTKMPPGTLPGPQGRPRDENDAKMTPNRPSKDPQGTPRGAPETPRRDPRTPKRAPGDPKGPRIGLQRSPRAPQGRTRDENDAKMTPNRPSNDAKTVPR